MMISPRCTLLVVVLLGPVAAAATLPDPLLSPWSGHPVHRSNVPYHCGALPHVAQDLTTSGFYRLDDPTHSIIDPVRQKAYTESSLPVKTAGMMIVSAADAFRETGSRQAQDCAIQYILTLAQQRSLTGTMSSSQAYYVQGWVVGAIAIDWLKVRDDAPLTDAQTKLVSDWLVDVGARTRAYYTDRHKPDAGDAANNHLYWAAVQLAAIAVAANNHDDFLWAIAAYDRAVRQIRPDGTLPLEMARGTRALHYHLYALAPLVLLAEFGEANHLHLYDHDDGALHRLVNVSVHGINDPALFVKATGIDQEIHKPVSGDQIGWAPPYLRRFPNTALQQLLESAPSLSVFYLGGLPPP